jgi:DNA-binding MltR family transcriptional regulator
MAASITIRSLNELSGDSKALYDAVNDEKDIACVLISTSFLDEMLKQILAKFFIDSTTSGALLAHTGIVGTMHSRAQLAYCVGLIPKGVFQNLERLGTIRNKFAHSHLSLTFSDPEVISLCEKLSFPHMKGVSLNCETGERVESDGLPDHFYQTPRIRFVMVATLTSGRLFALLDSTAKRDCMTKGWE